jgi:hypothetical protein
MRAVGQKNARGSLRWIRVAVNEYPSLLNRKVATACGFKKAARLEHTSGTSISMPKT